jgi:hypothetical protein
MSVLVKQNNLLVFGSQSPLYRVITEAGLKEDFIHLLIDNSSKIVRKRSFQTYLLATKIFPSNAININDGIRFGVNQFLLPFTKFGVQNSINSIMTLKPSGYIHGEIALTNEIAKATKIKNVLVIVSNSEKTTFANQKGITTYITRKFTASENQELDVAWSNGFFTFNDLSNLSILIVIPKQYLANLMINISSQNLDVGKKGTSIENNISFLDALKTEMIIDLIKSFFAAIYSDSYRHRVNTDIATLNTIFKEEGSKILTSAEDTEVVFNAILNKYRQTLQGFKESDCENIVYECMKLFQTRSHVTINPYEFYYSFIDLPYSHIKMVFSKIPIFKIFAGKSIQAQIAEPDFSNNLSTMDTFFEDEQRDIITYGLKLVRFLPFLIFNTYVIGGGNYHAQMLTLLSTVESFIGTINSFKNTSIIYGPLCNFIIEELTYMTSTLAKQMNSPLNVNNSSRHMVVNLIANSIVNLD